jgi:hypothetical protein
MGLSTMKKPSSDGIKQELDYVQSPIYKKRLQQSGVKNVDELISKRISALKKTKIIPAETQFQYNLTTGGQTPTIITEKGISPYTLQHEIVHAEKGGGESIPSYKDPYKALGTQMTPAESWLFYNRNKNLEQSAPQISVKGKPIQSMREKIYQQYTGGDYYEPDIAKSMYGKQYPTEMHKISAQENAGDLGALRKLLIDKKITKNYGDNIDINQLEKALSNPEIKNQPNVKRLLQSFDKKAIIDLNNSVAMLENNKNQNLT